MRKFFQRLIQSPIFIFLTLLDLISNIAIKAVQLTKQEINITTMFSQINWFTLYDIAIRILLTILVWRLYKGYIDLKKKQSAQFEQLKNKICALAKIDIESINIFYDNLEEQSQHTQQSVLAIVNALHRLGEEGIIITARDPTVAKFQGELNKNSETKYEKWVKILNDWTE